MEDRAPLSHECLEQIGAETKHAADKVLAAYVKRSLVGFLLLLVGIGVVFTVGQRDDDRQRADIVSAAAEQRQAVVQSGRAVSVAGCNRDFRTIRSVRASYRSAQVLTRAAAGRGEVTQRQLRTANNFYARQLARLTVPDCRKAATILTDDPEKPIVVPVPLHP